MVETEVIGVRLKARRERQQLTIKQVAERAQLSIGFISQVERGMVDPSLASLGRIVSALDMEMSELFTKDIDSVCMIQKGTGAKLTLPSSVVCELLAPSLSKQMEPTLKYIRPQSESGMLDGHAGEEFVLVIHGELLVTVDAEEFYLREGDSIYFQASAKHAWKNSGQEECRVLWVVTPPHVN